jgi:hypothetical protein
MLYQLSCGGRKQRGLHERGLGYGSVSQGQGLHHLGEKAGMGSFYTLPEKVLRLHQTLGTDKDVLRDPLEREHQRRSSLKHHPKYPRVK